MSFQNLGGYLNRFRNLRAPQKDLQRALATALLDCVGVRIEPSSITIQDETAFVRLSVALKNKIRVSKHEILSRLEGSAGVRLRDIR